MSSLTNNGGNDVVQTPDRLALAIVEHFQPHGTILEPCRGTGAFLRAFDAYNVNHAKPEHRMIEGFGAITMQDVRLHYIDSMEIAPTDGTTPSNFITEEPRLVAYNWIITNPPWSQFRAFLLQSMALAYNVVFLDKMNAWGFSGRLKFIEQAGYAFREIVLVDQPPRPWPQMGMQLAAVHISPATAAEKIEAQRKGKKGWLGNPTISRLEWTPDKPVTYTPPPQDHEHNG